MTSNEQNELHEGLQTAIDLYRDGRLDDAISLLARLGKVYPASPKLWGYLGFLYREADRLPPAVKCFRRTVELSPKSERASLGLFFTLRRMGKLSEAFKEVGRFAGIGKPVAYLGLLRTEWKDDRVVEGSSAALASARG